MELHIGLRFVLLVDMAKTIANCANVVIHVKKEYKTLNTKLSWDKLIMAKCQKQACLFSFVVITALLNVAHRERKAFCRCSPNSDIVKQNFKNTMSLHVLDTWCFDICIIFWRLFLLLKTL